MFATFLGYYLKNEMKKKDAKNNMHVQNNKNPSMVNENEKRLRLYIYSFAFYISIG